MPAAYGVVVRVELVPHPIKLVRLAVIVRLGQDDIPTIRYAYTIGHSHPRSLLLVPDVHHPGDPDP